MTKKHTEVLEFIKENVSKHRQRAMKVSEDESKPEEVRLREKVHYKRVLAFELLLNNLALLLMIPEMFEEVCENIEEIQICFVKLGLANSEEAEGKRSKKKGTTSTLNKEERDEALSVLTDFLISLLTKPQSFLRDVANFTFKQFCTEVPAASLQNLLKIVQTPNIEANQMLFGEDDENRLD
jgi:hypothetical protein